MTDEVTVRIVVTDVPVKPQYTDDAERADGRPSYNELHALWEKACDDSVTIHTQLVELTAAAQAVVDVARDEGTEGVTVEMIDALAIALESGIEPVEATARVRELEDALVQMTKRFNDECVAHKVLSAAVEDAQRHGASGLLDCDDVECKRAGCVSRRALKAGS